MENIDLTYFLAYNKNSMKNFECLINDKKTLFLYAIRAFLTVLVIAVVAFIFSNSLANGEQSAEQSHEVTIAVQQTIATIAPSSPIATAEGEDFEKLHNGVRTIAHFTEYTLLGGLAFWCYLSYTRKKSFAVFPILGVALVAVIDECIQSFVAGRAGEALDVLVDIAGGMMGVAFALVAFYVGMIFWNRRKIWGKKACK